MKIKVNRNILWTNTFVEALVHAGIKHACVSPGSRSTPLTYALAVNRKIKSHVIVDERSSGFFALGLAKATHKPVILVCTSGTAVAELYPAVIEAYQSKVPLIVCTADRPQEARMIGANQTINQKNLFRNHICWFIDAGLPQAAESGLKKIINIAQRAVIESSHHRLGPVHINFPFKEPFEPSSFTDQIEIGLTKFAKSKLKVSQSKKVADRKVSEKILADISEKIYHHSRGIIVVGVDNYTKGFFSALSKLSQKIDFPIFADAASNMRFAFSGKHNVLTNYDSYLRSESFIKNHQPDFIIQFGRNLTSKALSNFISNSRCEKLLVNQFGEWKNPKDKSTAVVAADPEKFCKDLFSQCKQNKNKRSEWTNDFLTIEKSASKIKTKLFGQAQFPNETRIVYEVINSIPDGSNLMVSNSLPIRDLDLVVPMMKKNIIVFHNRGASGIDGITSTALGIAQSSMQRTYLLTGDLAFYYDLNSLQTAKKYNIPLTIILINNNGGRIFEVLPISNYKNIFEEYFTAPHNLDFSKLVRAFGGNYREVKSWKVFKELLSAESTGRMFSVLELKTDPIKSLSLRRKYYDKVIADCNNNSKTLL